MRKLNWCSPYGRYHLDRVRRQEKQKVKPLHYEIRYSHSYPTPGCMPHDHPRRRTLFKRHVSQGNKTNMLYWRLHKEEYKQLKESY